MLVKLGEAPGDEAARLQALAGRATVVVSTIGADSTPERTLAEAEDALRAAAARA